MKTIFSFCIHILICSSLFAQDHSDAERLAKLFYMENASSIDCKNTTGSTIEDRICLNFEFQKIDSMLNRKYETVLIEIESDTLKQKFITTHNYWLETRRFQNELYSEGLSGHSLGIHYLTSMLFLSKNRIKEFDFLILKEYEN